MSDIADSRQVIKMVQLNLVCVFGEHIRIYGSDLFNCHKNNNKLFYGYKRQLDNGMFHNSTIVSNYIMKIKCILVMALITIILPSIPYPCVSIMSDDEREQLYWHIVEICLDSEELNGFFSINLADSTSQLVLAGGYASSARELIYNEQPVLYFDYEDSILLSYESYCIIGEFSVNFSWVRLGISHVENGDYLGTSSLWTAFDEFQDGWHLSSYYSFDDDSELASGEYRLDTWEDIILYDNIVPKFFNHKYIDSIIRLDLKDENDFVYISDMSYYAFNNRRPDTSLFNLPVRFYNHMTDTSEAVISIYNVKSFTRLDDKIKLVVYNWNNELLLNGYFVLEDDIWIIDSLASRHQKVIVH